MPLKRVVIVAFDSHTFTVMTTGRSRKRIVIPYKPGELDLGDDYIGRDHTVGFLEESDQALLLHLHRMNTVEE